MLWLFTTMAPQVMTWWFQYVEPNSGQFQASKLKMLILPKLLKQVSQKSAFLENTNPSKLEKEYISKKKVCLSKNVGIWMDNNMM